MTRRTIAEELLGCALDEDGCAPCPGRHHHTKQDGRRDFRLILEGAPTGYCFHGSCSADVEAFNKELRRMIWLAENGDARVPRQSWGAGVAPEPKPTMKARPPIDHDRLELCVRGVPAVDAGWFARRSAVDVASVTPGDFLNALFEPGERVLVFTDQRSQGDYLWCAGDGPLAGGWRLSQHRGTKASRSSLPGGAKEGVWFLVQPVTGQWEIAREYKLAQGPEATPAKFTRRSQVNVCAWRYFVLESDVLDMPTWLRVVASLSLPVAALYTSGGRSIHALVRTEVASKAVWDACRNAIRQIVCPLGADPAALSAVRLSRLPGCKRGDRMQELLYLNPKPDSTPIRLLPELQFL